MSVPQLVTCPADGEVCDRIEGGRRFECRHCRSVYRPEEVVPDV